jgi:hypothetical protein
MVFNSTDPIANGRFAFNVTLDLEVVVNPTQPTALGVVVTAIIRYSVSAVNYNRIRL